MGNPVNAGGLIMPLILMRETDAKSPLNTETALIHYLEPKTQSSSPIYSLRAKKKMAATMHIAISDQRLKGEIYRL